MNSVQGKCFTVVLCSLFFAIASVSLYAWPTVNGIAISTVANDQDTPTVVSDGTGGAIITWEDNRGSNSNIYTQRVNSNGSTLWTLDGVAICTAANSQYYPTIASDGSGGAIITWQDYRSGSDWDIYAQRVNSAGSTLWTSDGVAICTAGIHQYYPTIASDGSGGAVITWYDFRSGSNLNIYAQRVNSSGIPQWTLDGVAICTAANDQWYPTIASDGSGGAIITWQDGRNGSYYDIYAQRVNSNGSTLWTLDGVAMCTATSHQIAPQLVDVTGGGAVVVWTDARNGIYDIYAQYVGPTGIPQWTSGTAICTAANYQINPKIVTDGAGNAIITWQDGRYGNDDIYAQRLDSTGSTLWAPDGIAICTAANSQYNPTITGDSSGGAIITWQDYRDTTGNPGQGADIYAQRVNSSASTFWTLNGITISTAGNDQTNPTIVSDAANGAIITWQDYRDTTGNPGQGADVYAQRVGSNGNTDFVPVELSRFEAMNGIKE